MAHALGGAVGRAINGHTSIRELKGRAATFQMLCFKLQDMIVDRVFLTRADLGSAVCSSCSGRK